MTNPREQATLDAEHAAQELELAARHLRTAAHHVREGEIPRYAAHLLASQGHLVNVRHTLAELSVKHAARSHPTPAIPHRKMLGRKMNKLE